jgi:phosphate starvation-inducible PhoH-like protein
MTTRKRRTKKAETNEYKAPNDIIVTHVKFTPKQENFIALSTHSESKLFFIDGPAGTSKTYLSIYCALRILEMHAAEKLIYIRSAVESAAQKLGALPGEIDEKFKPWIIPLLDKLHEISTPSIVSDLCKKNIIEAHPNNYLRGMSYKDKAIIVDEAQNMTEGELTTILTRIGENCKVFVIGDSMQTDIHKSGFKTLFDLFDVKESNKHGIYCTVFDEEDIVRSELLKYIIFRLKKLHK